MFEFMIVIGLVMAYYGYAVSGNPRMWGEQGKKDIKPENWKTYVKKNGQFFMWSGVLFAVLAAMDLLFTLSNLEYILVLLGGEALLYYPFGKWMKEHENTWNAWPKRHKDAKAKKSKK